MAFVSRYLNDVEKNYSIPELELLAVVKLFSIYTWN